MIPVRKEAISKEAIDTWFGEWEALQIRIHSAHETRNGEAKSLTEHGIALFEKLLVDSASHTAHIDEEFELYPINGRERLQFIKQRPGQYACYRQLDELFKETKKRAARLRTKK
ncbi:YpoC family protein [Lysinibacillus sp. 54212]|uniref:YpoC family protein n=1 Tax=Lysinibacillus sp. 54212 TaxID=3119829 RepID=UPI002FC836BA